VLGSVAFVSALVFIIASIVHAAGFQLVAACLLAFLGIGTIRRAIVYFFPNLPYARIFTIGGIAFAILFPLVSYLLEKAFHLGLPLRYLFDLSILVLTYVMLGWGLNIVVGLAGLLDLGYVAFYAVGAYVFALLATHFGLGFWMCLPVAGIAAALWGVILGFPVLRLRGDYLAIVTLAFGEIVRIILINWTPVTNGPNGISDIPKPTFFGLPFSAQASPNFASFFGLKYDPLQGIIFLYYVILGLALVTNLVTIRLRRLPIGRAWEAMREDEIACRSLGINTTITKLTAFATGALFGGLAGSFFATRQGFISPESFTFIESAIISPSWCLAAWAASSVWQLPPSSWSAASRLFVTPRACRASSARAFDPALYRMLLFGVAMVGIMVWRPRGIVGSRSPTIVLHEAKPIPRTSWRKPAHEALGDRPPAQGRAPHDAFRRARRRRRCLLRSRPARHHCPDRAKRRGQDHGVQLHHRLLQAERRDDEAHPSRRPELQPRTA
jgi:branched-chain amino acid transport system permease protein